MINFLTDAVRYSFEQPSLWDQIMDFFYYNWILVIFISIAIVGFAQMKMASTTNKYSKVRNMNGLTGEEVAKRILSSEGIYDVEVKPIKGHLTDNYNPMKKTVYLSEAVFSQSTIVSTSVAAHEVGHAIQHAKKYFPLQLRQTSFYFARATSAFTGMMLIFAIIAKNPTLLWLGAVGIFCGLLFQVFTLPVEYNASKRAKVKLEELHLVTDDEGVAVKETLNAAALTYLAAMLSTLLYLLRILAIANSRN